MGKLKVSTESTNDVLVFDFDSNEVLNNGSVLGSNLSTVAVSGLCVQSNCYNCTESQCNQVKCGNCNQVKCSNVQCSNCNQVRCNQVRCNQVQCNTVRCSQCDCQCSYSQDCRD